MQFQELDDFGDRIRLETEKKVIEIAEGMMFAIPDDERHEGYNEALKQIISKLKEEI